jgi:hypothetical protein
VEPLIVAGWVLLVALTVGPIFGAQKQAGGGWFWIVAALLLGPLAGLAYYTSRHAMRSVDAAQREARHVEG